MPPQKCGLRFRAREMRCAKTASQENGRQAWAGVPARPILRKRTAPLFRVDPGLHIVAIEGNLLGERANGRGRSDAQGLGREVEMSGDCSV